MQGCQEKYASQIRRIIKDQLLHKYFHDNSAPSPKQLNNPNYFDKYFIGCTPDNIISDRMSYELAEKMSSDTEHHKNAITLDSFLDKYGWEEVRKMVSFIIDLAKDAHEKNTVAKKMAISISLMQFTGQGVQWWSVATFLCNIMNNMFLPATNSHHDIKLDEEIIFNTGKTIIESASLDFIPRFASVLYEYLKVERNKKNTLIKQGIDRIVQERGADELLKVGQWAKVRLLAAWAETDMAELDLLIEKKVLESEFDVIDFLQGFVEESTQIGNNYSWIYKIFPHNTPKPS